MKLITVHIPEAYLNAIDQLVAAEAYPNRSETIRVAIRDLLKNELGGFIKYQQEKPNFPNLVE
ncbi:MAG: ribbon-helix-helix domain-containing protein [Promethearchaeota archaeon]